MVLGKTGFSKYFQKCISVVLAESGTPFAEGSELAAALEAVLDERVIDERSVDGRALDPIADVFVQPTSVHAAKNKVSIGLRFLIIE